MSATFIDNLPEIAKIWSAKAIAGIIVADGVVTNAELSILRESISFLEDTEIINEIVEMVKIREKPKLQVLKTDRVTATKILISLAIVAFTDDKLNANEIEYFNYIAGKMGFEKSMAKNAMDWGREFIDLDKKKKQLIKKGKESTPVYINY
ncbi:MAG: hypothetical protein HN945_11690 [Deltaproteobacteria bacterium]|jgi:hypothetical protein|nr:hypothetical protein [Deltaproteobacteria bacterium]MBT4639413.1 hypothetical protein [Deltaproteobacteria bacterium]MBT6614637.1 hypothetical protein [Deltaproteobacteria bacterium]MBT7153097.1 hypothetical protein [Deltaproteobacteria bacterium]MBT7716286.1 hypothetical protein [Deltaproteobacteria bacterium]